MARAELVEKLETFIPLEIEGTDGWERALLTLEQMVLFFVDYAQLGSSNTAQLQHSIGNAASKPPSAFRTRLYICWKDGCAEFVPVYTGSTVSPSATPIRNNGYHLLSKD